MFLFGGRWKKMKSCGAVYKIVGHTTSNLLPSIPVLTVLSTSLFVLVVPSIYHLLSLHSSLSIVFFLRPIQSDVSIGVLFDTELEAPARLLGVPLERTAWHGDAAAIAAAGEIVGGENQQAALGMGRRAQAQDERGAHAKNRLPRHRLVYPVLTSAT